MEIRPSWTKLAVILLAGPFFLAACAGDGVRDRPSLDREDLPPDVEPPPPVTLRFDDKSIRLTAHTYCYGDGCVDGRPPENPPRVGSPDHVTVEFPLRGWSFSAGFTPAGEECGRNLGAELESLGGGVFRLRPVGYADTYDVTLFGEGDGDLFVTFRWTTLTNGPLPKPEGTLAIISDYGAGPTGGEVELGLSNLAKTPKKASATITVRADNGKQVTFNATREEGPCEAEGSVYWKAPEDRGKAAAALGGKRFAYEVKLILDGARYIGTATWPDDEIPDLEPYVELRFNPELPALGE